MVKEFSKNEDDNIAEHSFACRSQQYHLPLFETSLCLHLNSCSLLLGHSFDIGRNFSCNVWVIVELGVCSVFVQDAVL